MAAPRGVQVLRLAPDVFSRQHHRTPFIWLYRDLGQSVHRERWHQVFMKILVLVVAPDQHEIRLEIVQSPPRATKTVDEHATVLFRRRQPFIVGPLGTHAFRPVAWVFALCRGAVAPQVPPQDVSHVRVRELQLRTMCTANAQERAHQPTGPCTTCCVDTNAMMVFRSGSRTNAMGSPPFSTLSICSASSLRNMAMPRSLAPRCSRVRSNTGPCVSQAIASWA